MAYGAIAPSVRKNDAGVGRWPQRPTSRSTSDGIRSMARWRSEKGKDAGMATIRANCPDCGDVDLTTRDVEVHVCSSTNQGSYSFLCPSCRLAVSKLAEEQIVDLLISNGVRLAVWELPAEMAETK